MILKCYSFRNNLNGSYSHIQFNNLTPDEMKESLSRGALTGQLHEALSECDCYYLGLWDDMSAQFTEYNPIMLVNVKSLYPMKEGA